MPRPKKHRKISCRPPASYFKPIGIPMYELDEEILEADELEAVKLADLLKDSHEEAAQKMNISRSTFGRIVASARGKIADSLLNGKALRISEIKTE